MSELFLQNCESPSQVPKLCFCCLKKNVTFVNLATCKHFGILEKLCSVKIPNKELGGLLCYYCHAKLKAIYNFKLQAEESFTKLWKRQYTASEKAHQYEEVLLVKEEFNIEYQPEDEQHKITIKLEPDDVTEVKLEEVTSGSLLPIPHRPHNRGLLIDQDDEVPLPIVKVDVDHASELDEEPHIIIGNVPIKVADYHLEVSGLYLDRPSDHGTLSDDADEACLVSDQGAAEIEDPEVAEEAAGGPEKLPYRARRKGIKRQKGDHSAKDMLRAIRLYRQGMTMRKAAETCGLSYSTLNRYVQKNKNITDTDLRNQRLIPNYSVNRVFTEEQEALLAEYVKDISSTFYGLSGRDIRGLAYQMANVNNIPYPANWEAERMAGSDWLRSFKYRHTDLSLEKLKACNLHRPTENLFNKETVKSFFCNLKNIISSHPSLGNDSRIFNLDEIEIDVKQTQNDLDLKGRESLGNNDSEVGYIITTCAIVAASGQALPPVLIFPRKTADLLVTGTPPGSLTLASSSGRMDTDLFSQVIQHFIKQTSSSKENPSLLIIDNNRSHLSIQALDLAKKSGISVVISLFKMQPLKMGLNGKFKVYFNSALDIWSQRNPSKEMTVSNVAECVTHAYRKSMTPSNIEEAFKNCGIFPYDPDILVLEDFIMTSEDTK